MDDIEEIRALAVRAMETAVGVLGRHGDPVMQGLLHRLSGGAEFLAIDDLPEREAALSNLVAALRVVEGMAEDAPGATLMGRVRTREVLMDAVASLDACKGCVSFGQVRSALQGTYASDEVRDRIDDVRRAMDAYGQAPSPGYV